MRKESGFTLIELMVAISVLAILIGIGVPSMVEFLKNNRRAAAVNALVSDLQRGRSNAISTGIETVLCHSTTGAACSAAASPDWSDGWLLFVDTDADDTLDAGEVVLSRQGARNGLTMPSNRSGIVFRPGFRSLGSFGTELPNGTFAVCVDGTDNDRFIIVSGSGSARLQSDDNNSGSPPACP